MRKIFYLVSVSFSLVFASCSMNKDGINTASLQSRRLQTEQELTVKKTNHEKMAAINTQVEQNNSQQKSIDASGNTQKVPAQTLHKHLKPLISRSFAQKAGKDLTKITKLPNAVAMVNRIVKMPSHKAGVKDLPFQGANYLVWWIIFLVLAVVFFFLVNIFGELSILGLVFNILAVLALLAFLFFIILWTVDLYKAKK